MPIFKVVSQDKYCEKWVLKELYDEIMLKHLHANKA